ncbi:MAG: hypothetical protein KDN22_23825 [Verrucomicrobiae bacterium]|nr:hypothetical protein [Verrucomicrobiae bacterium]
MKTPLILLLAYLSLVPAATAQGISFFFPAGQLSGEDRFGNSHTVTPSDPGTPEEPITLDDVIEPLPFGDDDLFGVAIEEDNKWLIYEVFGDAMLVSNGPGGLEDSPELTMNITVKIGGKYEVVLNFLDERDNPGAGPIMAALGDDELKLYSEENATPKTGGTSPGYPGIDATTQGVMWWETVTLGEVQVEAGGNVKVRIDDTTSDFADPWITSTFQGITLRAIELDGAISEIQVSPGAFDWVTDSGGNQFKTGPVDPDLTIDDWLTDNANSSSDGLWNIRQGLGTYGPILESFPLSGDDAPTLQTSVIFAQSGIYDVFLNLGDTGAVDPDENETNSTPLNFAFEGEEFTRWHANDGVFKGTPGYNDYEMSVGQITVPAGEVINFLIDDVQDGTASRSVYLGLRFELVEAGLAPLPFQISSLVKGADAVTLSWASRANREYIVEFSPTLTPDSWIELDDGVASEGDVTTFSDPVATRVNAETGWYRVRQN